MATSGWNADVGGGRGYSLAFINDAAYASVNNYFTPSTQWPTNAMTMSLWVRWVGTSSTGTRSWPFTVIANNDPNHVQLCLNVGQKANGWVPNVEVFINQLTSFTKIPTGSLQSFTSSWTHVTMTFNLTDVVVYFNGTQAGKTVGGGLGTTGLRWSDMTALFLGGYIQQQSSDVTKVLATKSERFYGWLDDMAFYNRILTVGEISRNWQTVVDVTDPSLFLYYNFDEGPSSSVIINRGTIGSQGNLYNGQVLGSTTYMENTTPTPVTKAIFSPGVPLIGVSPLLPVVFAVDAGATVRLRITCQLTTTTTTAASMIPSSAQIVSLPTGTGKIYQTDSNKTPITAANTVVSSPGAEFWYSASATMTGSTMMDTMQYSCQCNGAQTGTINVIINPAVVPDQTLSMVVPGAITNINLHGSLANPGLMQVNITSLPTLGQLSQWDFEQPDLITHIVKPGTTVTNLINAIQYVPNDGLTGPDTFSYQLIHNGMVSSVATVQLSVQSWDFPPVIPLTATAKPVVILNRQATSLNLPAKDNQQKQYLGVYIMSLPTKGTLYQRNLDGSRGAIINQPFQYSFPTPSVQYATKILNISSFWGTSVAYNPIQMLGPQDCLRFGGCSKSWSAYTLSGTGGFYKGCGQGICFASNPDENYANFGYTEYIELGFNKSVIVNSLIDGENIGMGAVKNILAKDPFGNWMTLWTTPTIDNKIYDLYAKFNQYRHNTPDICQTPFFTNHIRYEIDTRDVSQWAEFDYFELHGLSAVDPSMVNWYGKAKWDVIYVPHADASGLDSFTYSATDCPGTLRVGFSQRWSPNVGTINVNIVPVGTAGTTFVDPSKGDAKIDLSQWSVRSNTTSNTLRASIATASNGTISLSFSLTSLPLAGTLRDVKGTITKTPYPISGSSLWYTPVTCCTASTCTPDQVNQQRDINNHTSFAYTSSDVNSKAPLTVSLPVSCPSVTFVPQVPKDVGVPIAIAIGVFVVVAGSIFGIRQMILKRRADLQARQAFIDGLMNDAKKAQEEAKMYQGERDRAVEREKEKEAEALKLAENIINTAHNIKSPATAIGLAVDSLLCTLDNKKPLSEEARSRVIETLHGMSHTTSSLDMLTSRSVDVSKITIGAAISPNKVPVDLEQLVATVVNVIKWQARGSNVDIQVEPLPSNLPAEILADEKWLKNDLMCIMANAAKNSRRNTVVKLIITVTEEKGTILSSRNSTVRFAVVDSGGVNLSPDQLQAMFDMPPPQRVFQFETENYAFIKSLGLYCMRQRVIAAGGKCGAQLRSDGKQGTEVWFTFPLITVDNNGRGTEKNANSTDKTTSFNGTKPIPALVFAHNDLAIGRVQGVSRTPTTKTRAVQSMLLVDDSPSILKVMKRCILNEFEKATIADAKNGADAFDLILSQTTKYNVVVTDIHMPHVNGFELTRKLRQLEKEKSMPATIIIGISGNCSAEIISQAKLSGMDGFVRKPFALSTLLDTIEQLLPEQPKSEDENFEEMTQVILDKGERGRRFYALAVKSLTTENIDFIRAVTDYEKEIGQEIVKTSGAANDTTREAAKKLYEKYIKQNCELEVNVCAATRLKVDKYLYQEWEDDAPLVTMSSDATSYTLIDDVRKQVFQPSLKEILHMTYQNLWNKFLGDELSLQLAHGGGEVDTTESKDGSSKKSMFSGLGFGSTKKKGPNSRGGTTRSSYEDKKSTYESIAEAEPVKDEDGLDDGIVSKKPTTIGGYLGFQDATVASGTSTPTRTSFSGTSTPKPEGNNSGTAIPSGVRVHVV